MNSQGPMLNPLTMKCFNKRSGDDMDGTDGLKEDKYKKRRSFHKPANADKINELSRKSFAIQSKKKIKLAVNMYEEWRRVRMMDPYVPSQIKTSDLNKLLTFSQGDFEYSMSRFVREVKKVDDSDFPPATLREIVIMIQMYLHENSVNWKLLDDEVFPILRNVLDNTMKERTAVGLGVRQSSSVISMAHEQILFRKNVFGEENPQQLLDTVIYLLGLHLALHGGVEHSRLRRPGFDCQIIVGYDNFGRKWLTYSQQPLQKTNQGGLCGKRDTKTVYVYSSSNIMNCPVRLFEKYIGLLPSAKSCKKLYMRPKIKPTPVVWYCDQAYGNNNIGSTVKKLCKMGGIEGKYTNHSLHATSASRMYQSDIPEQVIK